MNKKAIFYAIAELDSASREAYHYLSMGVPKFKVRFGGITIEYRKEKKCKK